MLLQSVKVPAGIFRGAFEDKRARVYCMMPANGWPKAKKKFDCYYHRPDRNRSKKARLICFIQRVLPDCAGQINKDGVISVQSGCASYTELLNLKAVSHTLKASSPS